MADARVASRPQSSGTPFPSSLSMSMPIEVILSVLVIAAATVVPLWLTLPMYPEGHARAPEARRSGSIAGRPGRRKEVNQALARRPSLRRKQQSGGSPEGSPGRYVVRVRQPLREGVRP